MRREGATVVAEVARPDDHLAVVRIVHVDRDRGTRSGRAARYVEQHVHVKLVAIVEVDFRPVADIVVVGGRTRDRYARIDEVGDGRVETTWRVAIDPHVEISRYRTGRGEEQSDLRVPGARGNDVAFQLG